MKTWRELVAVTATFYPAGHILSTPLDWKYLYAFDGNHQTLELINDDTQVRFAANAIQWDIAFVPSPSWMDTSLGVSFLDHRREDVKWDSYASAVAGVVMSKRLASPTQTTFQFLTLWSITESVYRDGEGFKDVDHEIDVEGEFNLDTLHINPHAMAFALLQYIHEGCLRSPHGRVELSYVLKRFPGNTQGAYFWLLKTGMIDCDIEYVIGVSKRGHAFLRGDVLR